MHRLTRPLIVVALAIAIQALSASAASAHRVILKATALCVETNPAITFTISGGSTYPNGEGSNPQIEVRFNGLFVGNYATTLPTNVVTDTQPAPFPLGSVVTVTATAMQNWGDGAPGGQSASVSVTLPTDCGAPPPPVVGTGRFTGGGNTVDAGGVKLTRGFTIHCDLLLSNNLEINWPGAGRQNQFHMLEHTSAECFDDPVIDQRPPVAPVDTIRGVGTGRYNGELGYTVYFTLVDAGEPGRSDQIGLRVVGPTGIEVLNLPLQNITGGNVQAHYDQPHRNRP